MSEDPPRTGFWLSRWSARKHAAARADPVAQAPQEAPRAEPAPPEQAHAAPRAATDSPTPAVAMPALAATPTIAVPPAARPLTPAASEPPLPPPLPPIESLTPASDFTPFMRPDVDPALRGAALRKLFADPHFNVMDGLDVYIDDYTKPDPIEPSAVARLVQARYLFSPPETRVNAQGHVEDVPPDEPAAEGADAPDVADASSGVANAAVPAPSGATAGEPAVAGAAHDAANAADRAVAAAPQPEVPQLDLPLVPSAARERT